MNRPAKFTHLNVCNYYCVHGTNIIVNGHNFIEARALRSDYKLVLMFVAFSGMEQSGRVARLVQLFENPANIQGKYFLCLTTIVSNK